MICNTFLNIYPSQGYSARGARLKRFNHCELRDSMVVGLAMVLLSIVIFSDGHTETHLERNVDKPVFYLEGKSLCLDFSSPQIEV